MRNSRELQKARREFKVHIFGTGMISVIGLAAFCCAVEGGEQRPATEVSSVMRIVPGTPAQGPAMVELNEDVYRRLPLEHRVIIKDFPLGDGQSVELDVERFTVTTGETRFVVGTDGGDVTIPSPDVLLLRGEVVGHHGSSVYLGLSPSGSNGMIDLPGRRYILGRDRSQPAGAWRRHVIYDSAGLGARVKSDFLCQTETGPEPATPDISYEGAVTGGYPFRTASVAVECDYEYGQSFDNLTEAAAYVVELFGAVSSIYERELQVKLHLPYVRVWSTTSDPYSGNDVLYLLPQFENYWRANMGSVERDIAHFLTSKMANGGLAEVDVLCDDYWGYGSSSGIVGSFPVPLVDGSLDNWDLLVVSHEMGHQFGSPHTHCYSPPIDKCWNTESGCWSGAVDCSQQGTIMSYCKSCPGGLINLDLDFGDRVIQRIRQSVDPSCLRSGMNPVFVDWTNNTGIEFGTVQFPFNTVGEGVPVVMPGGTIYITTGNYPGAVIANRPMVLVPNGGSVRIGQ